MSNQSFCGNGKKYEALHIWSHQYLGKMLSPRRQMHRRVILLNDRKLLAREDASSKGRGVEYDAGATVHVSAGCSNSAYRASAMFSGAHSGAK